VEKNKKNKSKQRLRANPLFASPTKPNPSAELSGTSPLQGSKKRI